MGRGTHYMLYIRFARIVSKGSGLPTLKETICYSTIHTPPSLHPNHPHEEKDPILCKRPSLSLLYLFRVPERLIK